MPKTTWPKLHSFSVERRDGKWIVVPEGRRLLTQEERTELGRKPGRCYFCGAEPEPPHEMYAAPGNAYHGSFVLWLRHSCCHMDVSTEAFGTVVDYLCDGWARAQLICRLYNLHAGLPELPSQPHPVTPWGKKRELRG